MKTVGKILLYLGLVIFIVLVAEANSGQRVDVTWFPGRTFEDLPVFVVILGSVFFGVLLAGLIGAAENVRQKAKERQLRREIDVLEREVRDLRNLPVTEGLRDAGGEPGPPPEPPEPPPSSPPGVPE